MINIELDLQPLFDSLSETFNRFIDLVLPDELHMTILVLVLISSCLVITFAIIKKINRI